MTIESAGSAPAQPVEAAPRRKNFFERLVGVFFSPGETFEDIARKPDWLLPLLLIVLVTAVSAIITVPRLDFSAIAAQQEEAMRKQGRELSEADRAQMERVSTTIVKTGYYLSPLIVVVVYLLVALVLWGAFRLMGGEGDFPQAWSATLYAHFPRVLLGAVIGTIIVVARGGLVSPEELATVMKSSPAFLVDLKEQPVLFALLSSFELFLLWTVALLIAGFSKLSKLSIGKSAAIVISLWIVTILVKVGFAALGAAMQKG